MAIYDDERVPGTPEGPDQEEHEAREQPGVATLSGERPGKPRTRVPSELPILPLKGTVVFPLTVVPLAAGQERSLRLIDDVINGDRLVGLVMQKDASQEGAGPDDVYEIGALGVVHQMMRVPDGTVRLASQGLERIRRGEFTQDEPYLKARVEHAPEIVEDTLEVQALVRNALDLFQRLVSLVANLPDELLTAAINVEEPQHLVYFIASNLRLDAEDRQQLLELDSVKAKLEMLNGFMSKELEVLELGKKIQSDVQEEVSKNQREYFLREQLKAIQRELGETNEQEAEVNEYRRKIDEAGMPEEAEKEARRELDRLSKLPPAAAEYGVIKTYLDWLTSLPWNKSTEGDIDIAKARQILDEDHYDLEKIKERSLEYLAVRRLRKEQGGESVEEMGREPILCFVGPPGVGKTSLAQSIARALGRQFARMSLGGVRDEAEIRGHRRTYIGAMPGRVIQAMRRAGVVNPVLLLDEIDKLGHDYRGDPAAALLEVLDPEQNRAFNDHYLEVDYDLSQVLFITTANYLPQIPEALRDRMEVIRLSGYLDQEKYAIARRFLAPKQLRQAGLDPQEVNWESDVIPAIVHAYTREAGVRELERRIARVARKLARKRAEGSGPAAADPVVTVRSSDLKPFLGTAPYDPTELTLEDRVGVATGLAYTTAGGEVLEVEVSALGGRGKVQLTGTLGDVMKESASAAISYARARAGALGIDREFYRSRDLHVHIPAGATPKDGPSAGIAIATALVSALTGVAVRGTVAMTGEVTLRGRVLP